MTWTFDAPSGVWKSHAMSRRLYEQALEETVFMDHVRPVPGYGKHKGETVTLYRISDIDEPSSPVLDERQRIPEDEFTLSSRAITVSEIGRAVPYTELLIDLSVFDLENPIQQALRAQMRLTLDTMAAQAFRRAKIKYAITGTSSNNIATNGTFGATSSANMNLYHVEEIRDYMYDTIRVPMVGDSYVAIFRSLGLRGIKRDPDWMDWEKYTSPNKKYNSELGKLENIRFVETNHNNALRKVGTGSVLGEGVVFGQDAVAMAEVLEPELRAAIPSDFGRAKAVAWYGILAMDTVFDSGNAGEAKILHVGSL